MQKGDVINLSKVEQQICTAIATARFHENREKGVLNKKVGKQSNEATDLEGFAAEFAFCKLFNLYPDFTIEPRRTEDDCGDAVLPCGQTVDVKATKYPTGRLLAVPWKGDNLDLYALMVGEFPNYTFKGFMKREELHKANRLGSLGYGETYIAQQDELKELSEIISGVR